MVWLLRALGTLALVIAWWFVVTLAITGLNIASDIAVVAALFFIVIGASIVGSGIFLIWRGPLRALFNLEG
jgi:hypothetical protein